MSMSSLPAAKSAIERLIKGGEDNPKRLLGDLRRLLTFISEHLTKMEGAPEAPEPLPELNCTCPEGSMAHYLAARFPEFEGSELDAVFVGTFTKEAAHFQSHGCTGAQMLVLSKALRHMAMQQTPGAGFERIGGLH